MRDRDSPKIAIGTPATEKASFLVDAMFHPLLDLFKNRVGNEIPLFKTADPMLSF